MIWKYVKTLAASPWSEIGPDMWLSGFPYKHVQNYFAVISDWFTLRGSRLSVTVPPEFLTLSRDFGHIEELSDSLFYFVAELSLVYTRCSLLHERFCALHKDEDHDVVHSLISIVWHVFWKPAKQNTGYYTMLETMGCYYTLIISQVKPLWPSSVNYYTTIVTRKE